MDIDAQILDVQTLQILPKFGGMGTIGEHYHVARPAS